MVEVSRNVPFLDYLHLDQRSRTQWLIQINDFFYLTDLIAGFDIGLLQTDEAVYSRELLLGLGLGLKAAGLQGEERRLCMEHRPGGPRLSLRPRVSTMGVLWSSALYREAHMCLAQGSERLEGRTRQDLGELQPGCCPTPAR